jgi:hypothetical protein
VKCLEIELLYINGETMPFVGGMWGHISPVVAVEMEKQLQEHYADIGDLPALVPQSDVTTVKCSVCCEDDGWGIDNVLEIRGESFREVA